MACLGEWMTGREKSKSFLFELKENKSMWF